MRYPRVSYPAVLQIARRRWKRRLSGSHPGDVDEWWMTDIHGDLGAEVKWSGYGANFDDYVFEEARNDIEALVNKSDAEGLDSDQIEGKAACHLYRAVEDARVETPVLDDPGFWRYIVVAHMWNFTVWREKKATFSVAAGSEDASAGPSDRFKPYIDGRTSTECLPTRMYLRIKALGGLEYGHLAWAVSGGTDFWRSHVLRVRTGEYPPLVRAMVQRQAETSTRLSSDPLRVFAKELNRTLVSLVPGILNDRAADDLVGELWERQLA